MLTGSGTLHARCYEDKCIMLFPLDGGLRNSWVGDSWIYTASTS